MFQKHWSWPHLIWMIIIHTPVKRAHVGIEGPDVYNWSGHPYVCLGRSMYICGRPDSQLLSTGWGRRSVMFKILQDIKTSAGHPKLTWTGLITHTHTPPSSTRVPHVAPSLGRTGLEELSSICWDLVFSKPTAVDETEVTGVTYLHGGCTPTITSSSSFEPFLKKKGFGSWKCRRTTFKFGFVLEVDLKSVKANPMTGGSEPRTVWHDLMISPFTFCCSDWSPLTSSRFYKLFLLWIIKFLWPLLCFHTYFWVYLN